jgi:hypothetical protein
MEDRFTNLDVEHVASARLSNRVGGDSRIIRSAAAGSELLRIAEVALDQQIRWLPAAQNAKRRQTAPAKQLRRWRRMQNFSFWKPSKFAWVLDADDCITISCAAGSGVRAP